MDSNSVLLLTKNKQIDGSSASKKQKNRPYAFELAMIGEEVSGDTNQNEITIEDLGKITCILPISLQKRLGVQEKGEELSKQLRLFN